MKKFAIAVFTLGIFALSNAAAPTTIKFVGSIPDDKQYRIYTYKDEFARCYIVTKDYGPTAPTISCVR